MKSIAHAKLQLPAVLTVLCALLLLSDRSSSFAAERSFSSLDFTNHLKNLSPRVPRGFTTVVQPPFVVIGDQSPEEVHRWATHTVKWAVDHLKRAYFPNDPDEIIDIWLFKDKQSYDKHTRSIFHDTPTTPFGYYSPSHRALIMNIATGGGTLVHEIVHPFVRANFPACPPWLNEGLGSLYEQCGEKNDHIYGYTNWRLADLQTAIRSRETIPLAQILNMNETAFYSDRGLKYSQARYLCYYLQERGLLLRFYKNFHSHAATDPSGLQTLKQILATDDLAAFQKEWESFVLKLKFP